MTAWAVVHHHVQVLECLECVVQLRHEPMLYLSLDLLFSDDESSEAVVGTLLHTLHRVVFARPLTAGIQSLD